jgi:hypothetical protein
MTAALNSLSRMTDEIFESQMRRAAQKISERSSSSVTPRKASQSGRAR